MFRDIPVSTTIHQIKQLYDANSGVPVFQQLMYNANDSRLETKAELSDSNTLVLARQHENPSTKDGALKLFVLIRACLCVCELTTYDGQIMTHHLKNCIANKIHIDTSAQTFRCEEQSINFDNMFITCPENIGLIVGKSKPVVNVNAGENAEMYDRSSRK